ncbi:MAG TPA: ATP-binding cassette domain-containing protein [Bacteroidales bacterium]|nr:ATP-binding cassette domain-containing protein [Bacteroidales bacterium]HOH83359.1 ATP-binding cassette domain-containing protein [Bacteroidales bacterium]HPB25552.1 ATP-binding cassette domain-containing protein [Bacteroidales bacterium]HPI29085.1 ATP-binding cassette domain-containing protein [Bacteroidales bacterium]HQN15821.1 ATP-binding cassette domain-containing protein [Bacteroidales bacterium]
MNVLETRNITKRFANHVALNGVSISVPEQSIFGLLGPNGAGKTTLIRIINMITGPDEGEVFLKGEKLEKNHIVNIGYLPEERGLYKKMKVGEQAIYLAQLRGLTYSDAIRKLRYWFEKFELMSWWNRKVEELSKGMQQKIQFIVTVLHEPKLLIFDEPFSGFDPINASLIKDEILRLRDNGATVVFSTHNMASVEELCDDIALINKSNKILEGKVNEIKYSYRSFSYQVEIAGTGASLKERLNKDFEVYDEVLQDGLLKAKIKILNNKTTNDMLSALMPHGTIHALHEIVPTMNDIFIAKVNADINLNYSSSGLTE